MKAPGLILAAIASLTLTAPAPAADAWEGVVRARHDLELSLTVGGLIREVLVDPGDPVDERSPLVRLDDDSARAQVELLRFRAASQLAIEAAQAKLDMAKVEEQIVRGLRADDAAGAMELQKAELQTRLADLELRIAQQQREELRIQLARAEQELSRYELRSPIQGVVEKVEVSEGESVEALETVVRVVVTDPLRVEVFIPTDQTLTLERGDPAWVQLLISEHNTAPPAWREGVVSHIAAVADSASAKRLIWIDLPNPDKLPAGTGAMVALTHAQEADASRGRGGIMQLRHDPIVRTHHLRLGNAQHQRNLASIQTLGVPQHHQQAILQRQGPQNRLADAQRRGTALELDDALCAAVTRGRAKSGGGLVSHRSYSVTGRTALSGIPSESAILAEQTNPNDPLPAPQDLRYAVDEQ